MPVNPKAMKGLKEWAKKLPTKDIAKHLENHDIEDPAALAVWLRKKAIGSSQFKKNQEAARKKA
jgi:hypothetical protein